MMSKSIDPLSRPAASIFFVDRDQQGKWVVREKNGALGGLFVNRAQAVKFVLESGRSEVVIGISELEFAHVAQTSNRRIQGSHRSDCLERPSGEIAAAMASVKQQSD
ncbi:hypothetical protein [Bradyrhizobium centrosematis]|uniref:hypothetical protein n=1 Tax=Bradyrhizobium centrosematis TaxID=1300039 RepID=UPI00388DEBA3